MDSRKAWSCSHSGLLNRSVEIFTAALDMAESKDTEGHGYIDVEDKHVVGGINTLLKCKVWQCKNN